MSSSDTLSRATSLLSSGPPGARPARTTGSLAEWRTHRAIGYIESNLPGLIRIPDVARQVNLSVSHFSRAFRSTLGASPGEYIMRRRIDMARELMRASDQALARIAVDCGWSDQSHFCRTFRRVVGVSPNAWRRTTRPARSESDTPL